MITIFTSPFVMTTPQDDLKTFETEVEKDLLDTIVESLKDGKMELDRAQQLSQEFLKLLPFQDKKDILKRLGEFSEKYQEAKGVYVKYAAQEEAETTNDALAKMSRHIQNGDIEAAIAVAKGGE